MSFIYNFCIILAFYLAVIVKKKKETSTESKSCWGHQIGALRVLH